MDPQPSPTSAPLGLLIMAYGTPDTLDGVEAYYTHIRRGRAPSAEQVADLVARYEMVGGVQPLRRTTFEQAERIGELVRAAGHDVRTYVGLKHWHPYVAEAVRAMAADGIRQAVGIVLAPHYSRMSVGQYITYAEEERAKSAPDMRIRYIERWGMNAALIDDLACRVSDALGAWDRERTLVVFTAHSLPERVRTWNDPYESEVRATAEAVATRLGLPHWSSAWQSASPTGEPWIGPDLLQVMDEAAAASRYTGVVVCAAGFVADNLEIRYDLDIRAAEHARQLGLLFRRTAMPNADPPLAQAVAAEVARCIAHRSGSQP